MLRESKRARPPSDYAVSQGEIEAFVEGNVCVANWVRKYASGAEGGFSGSRLNKARILCRFFKWLRVKEKIVLSPEELLGRHKRLRRNPDSTLEEDHWLLNLAFKHSRDNRDFKDYSGSRRYTVWQTVKSFCDYFESPLTSARNVYGKKGPKKNRRKQITSSETKELLGRLSQRDRALCLIMFQSGMGVGTVLDKLNFMWHSQLKPQLDAGCERVKVEFDERKGSGKWYFTYFSRDAIQELRKWMAKRERIVEKLIREGKAEAEKFRGGEPIFITYQGRRLGRIPFAHLLQKRTRGKVTSHMFRKLFKSEAGVPGRAIDPRIIKFFMGHIVDLTDFGGVYGREPEIYEEVFEREYEKLEPYVNIYSGVQDLSEEEKEWMRFSGQLRKALEKDPEMQKKFLQFLENL